MKAFFWITALSIILIAGGGCSSQNEKPPRANQATLPLTPSTTGFKTPLFTSANVCAQCHDGIRDRLGADVSVQLDWSSTMMAQSATDPLFQATLARELGRFPAQRAEIERQCSRCHAPMATLEAESAGTPITLTGSGFLDSKHAYHAQAKEGVGCTLCHKLADVGSNGFFSGNFSLDNSGVIFGGWQNADTSPMYAATGYSPVYGAHLQRSSICASCHELVTSVRDSNGIATLNRFPAQTVYTEWINSNYGQTGGDSCQTCHMPIANGVIASAKNPERSVARDGFSRHVFVGGNAFMLDMLGDNRQELGIAANNFAQTSTRTRALLAKAATIGVNSLKWDGPTFEFTVKVENKSGHKFPTSHPARRAFLHVTVRNGAGNIVFESGKTDSDGRIQGADTGVPGAFTPHFSHISAADQVQIYEAVMADSNGQLTHSQLRAAGYLKDNRVLPAGYQHHLAPRDIRPDSATLQDGDYSDSQGLDHTHFRLDGLAAGPYVVEAELKYQALSWPALTDLVAESASDPLIARFARMNDKAKVRIETVASASGRIN